MVPRVELKSAFQPVSKEIFETGFLFYILQDIGRRKVTYARKEVAYGL